MSCGRVAKAPVIGPEDETLPLHLAGRMSNDESPSAISAHRVGLGPWVSQESPPGSPTVRPPSVPKTDGVEVEEERNREDCQCPLVPWHDRERGDRAGLGTPGAAGLHRPRRTGSIRDDAARCRWASRWLVYRVPGRGVTRP